MSSGIASVLDYGADPTAARTSHAEIQRALDDLSVRELLFPPGIYDLRQRLEVNRPVRLRGIGPGQIYPSTILACEPGTAGIMVGPAATGTVIEDLGLEGLDLTQPNNIHGIEAHTRIHTKRLRIKTFPGYGLYIHASTPDSSSLSSDEGTVIESCGLDGFYIHGNDANAGCFMLTSSNNNKGAGIRDESFLGNTFLSPHTENNLGPAYHIGAGPSQAVLVNAYAEGGQGKCYFGPTVLVLGFQSGTNWEGGQVIGVGGSTALFANCVVGKSAATFRGWASDRSTPPLVVTEQNGHNNFAVWDDGTCGEPLGFPPAQRPKLGMLIRRFEDDPAKCAYFYFGLADATTGYAGGPAILAARSMGPHLRDGVLEFLSQTDRPGGIVGYFPAFSLKDGRCYAGDSGFVTTRLTTAQRLAMPNPPESGTCVFDLDLKKPLWYDGAAWIDGTGAAV